MRDFFATLMFVIAVPFAFVGWVFGKIAEGFVEYGESIALTDEVRVIRKR